MKNQWRS